MRENPAMSFNDVMREISILWARMDDEEKETYNQKSTEDRRRFLEE